MIKKNNRNCNRLVAQINYFMMSIPDA